MYDGILLIDKPQGMSSHDVVVAIRRLAGMRQVGHTGTLDPHASGLLVLCLGRATKFAHFFENLVKTYWTVLQLGIRTDTQDASGSITSCCQVPSLSREQLDDVLSQFIGPLQQIPPMYSAVKHQGQRLYRLARQGLTVPRQPRQIFVQRLTLLDVRREGRVTFAITCSKGTYIRTLCEDIGCALGCGAHMVYLQRCQVGPFCLPQAYSLTTLHEYAQHGDFADVVVPLAQALDFLPTLMLTAQQYEALRLDHRKTLSTILNPIHGWQLSATCYRLCTTSAGPFAVMHQMSTTPARWRLRYLDPALSA